MSTTLKDELELLSPPGDTIAETLEHIKMSQVELAMRMGKTPSKINDLISGKEPITTNTALQLEKVLGIDAKFWLNREMLYREKLSRLEQEDFLEQCIEWTKKQPIKELRSYGYIKSEKPGTAMANECLHFYGVASPSQWESVYLTNYIGTNFKKSEAYQSTLSAMAAWLRMGEIEMQKLNLGTYDKEAFKENLIVIRKLVRDHPEDFASQLQQLCALAGVGLVYTINIPKAPISGATRWIGGNPLIQLTDRGKSNDLFWFTFFHEVGHIMLHGKKEVFIEEFSEYKPDIEKEHEADEYANKILLPEDILKDFSEEPNEKTIRQVARKYMTHPAIVLGRLKHLGMVHHSFGHSLKFRVILDNMINKKNN
jgi:addiction module HigA family antidote